MTLTLEYMTWQLQEAENHLSEVIEMSTHEGPQTITRYGRDTAVVMSYEDYQRFITSKSELKAALVSTELGKLDLTRDKSASGRATDHTP